LMLIISWRRGLKTVSICDIWIFWFHFCHFFSLQRFEIKWRCNK
jgi:hypothetical protein